MRIFALYEGCVTQIPVQYFRNQPINHVHDLHKFAMKEPVTRQKLKSDTSSN